MNTPLKLFTDPIILARVQRPLLTRLLEDNQGHLPPDAAALLKTSLNGLTFEEYCSAWATQFGSANQFGGPLLEALHAIEFLALPESASTLTEALSHLPPGYEINRDFSTLHQALHLWMLAHSPAGVPWPSTEQREERREERGKEPPRGGDSLSPVEVRGGDSLSPGTPAVTLSDQNDAPPSVLSAEGPAKVEGSAKEGPLSSLPSPLSEPEAANEDPAESDAKADAVPIRRLKPWPEPISDAPALFDQVHDRALHYLFLPPGAAVVFAIWPGHSHAVKAFTHSPRLYVTSTEAGCGKTTALDFIACLCPDVLRTDNLKPAVLFRVTHKHEPTLVLDEFDSYGRQYPDLRGLINAGHNLHGCATRCEGPNVRFFKAYAATAIAGIGELAPTLAQRSIIIRLTKAPAGALQARFDRRHTKFETTLGRKIARWVHDNYAAIAACDPVMPPECINRLADNWRPLFAMAQVIGGHWPQRLLEAFKELQNSEASLSPVASSLCAPQAGPFSAVPSSFASGQVIGDQLLADVRKVFANCGAERLFSSYIVRALHALPNSVWAGTSNGGKPISVTSLARHLSSFGIHSRPIRIGADLARGYLLANLAPCQPPALDFQI